MATHMLSREVFHRVYRPFLRAAIVLYSSQAPDWAGQRGIRPDRGDRSKKKIQEERKNKRVTQEIWPAPPAQVEGPTQDRSLAPGVQAQQAGTLSLKTEATPGSPGTT